VAFDEQLAERLRRSLAGRGRIEEVRAFGGVMFMLDDKMCVGVSKDRMMVRVDPAKHDALVQRKGATVMDFTHRPMRGFLFIRPEGLSGRKSVDFWVGESVSYVRTVPVKRKKGKARKAPGKRPSATGRAPRGSSRR
jgi:hypothetical protein